MLNIPQNIQSLIKSDSVYKNFRVKFCGSGKNDLTNSDIVQDSVKFTESLCSRNSFQLGLCESPQIEFETVGVGDISGQTIECSIELDCESIVVDRTESKYLEREDPGAVGGYFKAEFVGDFIWADRVVFDAIPGEWDSLGVSYTYIDATGAEQTYYSVGEIVGDHYECPILKSNVIKVTSSARSRFKATLIGTWLDEGMYYSPSIGKYIYPIKYGTFVVESCKRQAISSHRSVVGYGIESIVDYQLLPGLKMLYGYTWSTQETIKLNGEDLLELNFPSYAAKKYEKLMTEAPKTSMGMLNYSPSLPFYTSKNVLYNIRFVYKYFQIASNGNKIVLYKTQYDPDWISEAYQNTIDTIVSLGVESSTLESIKAKLRETLYSIKAYSDVSGVPYDRESSTNDIMGFKKGSADVEAIADNNYHTYFAKKNFKTTSTYTDNSTIFSGGKYFVSSNLSIYVPCGIVLYSPSGAGQRIDIPLTSANTLYYYAHELSGTDPLITLTSLKKKVEVTKWTFDSHGNYDKAIRTTRTDYSFSTQVEELFKTNLRDIVQSYIELQGRIGRFDRNGNFELYSTQMKKGRLYPSVSLYPSYAEFASSSANNIYRSEYEQIIYEDYPVRVCDLISVNYKNTDNVDAYAEADVPSSYEYGVDIIDTKDPGMIPWRITPYDDYERATATIDYSAIELDPDYPTVISIDNVNGNGKIYFDKITITFKDGTSWIQDFDEPYSATSITIDDEAVLSQYNQLDNIVYDIAILKTTVIGTINFVIGTETKTPIYDDVVGEVYNLDNNWYVKNSQFTESKMEKILSNMSNSLMSMQYTPTEITMKGRPDLECGDWLTIDTNEGVIATIILERTLSGVQSLKDNITARGV